MTTIIARAAESVHWYQQDGRPQYTVTAKDGSERPTTLRDARKMNLVPSVTTVLKSIAKPGLEAWKLEQMLLSALTLPRIEGESEKTLIARITADSKEEAKKAAERGVSIHESIEKWMRGDKEVAHVKIASAFEEQIWDHFKTHPLQKWNIEHCFASTIGFGGKVDMFIDVNLGVVLDLKTKEFGPEDKMVGYEEQLMQLAAYRNGLCLPFARCANVFASSTHPGLIRVFEWTEADLKRGWRMFQHLLSYWKLKNNFGVDDADAP